MLYDKGDPLYLKNAFTRRRMRSTQPRNACFVAGGCHESLRHNAARRRRRRTQPHDAPFVASPATYHCGTTQRGDAAARRCRTTHHSWPALKIGLKIGEK
ncbi:hypothetical protein L596_020913 [Steinernema carpocapsae]|uniref:Uncharacterized protein n=1 Tax=Steinernema carpocapsae TaxID=34508 RepID=A0A4U5MUZ6_STECR|nr:hypothetical protein L596_020913 [Steinernema carpocapsae]